MTTSVVTARGSTTVGEAVKLMQDKAALRTLIVALRSASVGSSVITRRIVIAYS